MATAAGSAVAQAVAKLKAHGRLNALRAELEELESRHRAEMRLNYDRQTELCRQLGWPEAEPPPVLREPERTEEAEEPASWWRRWWRRLSSRLLSRRAHTLADGSPHSSRFGIIGRHAASFSAGAVWRVASVPIMNVARPMAGRLLSFVPRLLTFAPRLATFGGSGGGSILASTATSTGLRFALGAFNVIGIVLGPALAAWSIFGEVRKVKRAKQELESTRIQREAELAAYAARTRRLQRRLADGETTAIAARPADTRQAVREHADARPARSADAAMAGATRRGDLSRPARQSYSIPPASDS